MIRPLKHKGLNNKKYWVLFTDDQISFKWIYYILNRDSAAFILKQFVHIIKTQTGITIGYFWLDGTAEWFSKDITNFFKNKNILTKTFTPYTTH